jgi:hypothetical protein
MGAAERKKIWYVMFAGVNGCETFLPVSVRMRLFYAETVG